MFNLCIFLMSLLVVVWSKYGCSDKNAFTQLNPGLKQDLFGKGQIKHPLAKMMFIKATSINLKVSDKVRKLKLKDREIVVEKIEAEEDRESVIKEIEMIKKICKMGPKEISHGLAIPMQTPIDQFLACTEEEKDIIYIFREKLDFKLSGKKALEGYGSLSGKQKADAMLSAISKMEQIHKEKIVHGNIKLNSIMTKGQGFTELKIVNFRSADKEGGEIRVVNPYFTAPEYAEKPPVYSLKGDIYSLAATFAAMDLSVLESLSGKMGEDCLEPQKQIHGECRNIFTKEVEKAFNEENGTALLKGVMAKALSNSPTERYQSMEEFRKAIEALKDQLPATEPAPAKKEGAIWDFIQKMADVEIDMRYMFEGSETESQTNAKNNESGNNIVLRVVV